jgi:hypothetical protein
MLMYANRLAQGKRFDFARATCQCCAHVWPVTSWMAASRGRPEVTGSAVGWFVCGVQSGGGGVEQQSRSVHLSCRP